METIKFEQKKTVEAQANCQELPTLVLISRLKDQDIRKQLIRMLQENEKYKDGRKLFLRNDDGDFVKGADGKNISETYIAKTEEQINEEIEKRLSEIASDTPFDYRVGVPNVGEFKREIIHLGFDDPMMQTPRGISFIEAHEKGHYMRPYEAPEFRKIFETAFDSSVIVLSHEQCDLIRAGYLQKSTQSDLSPDLREHYLKKSALSDEKIIEEKRSYCTKPQELAEQMSSLKNYFGFYGNEPFTKEHLIYARNNIMKDTPEKFFAETHFFDMITPERENAFIELINRAGI